jgi:endonuclease/exonuclease/phosphatase family metal-dependent hydrolase
MDVDIVCLQEADGFKRKLTGELSSRYPTILFRDSDTRVGGEYAFLSKYPARDVAWIDSETGWFGAWIMKFETPAGPVQMMNVHLRPPFKGRGKMAVVRGYLFTSNDGLREMEYFFSRLDPNVPLIVLGDFNDTEQSRAVRFLMRKGFKNALRQFDRSTPTWVWRTRTVTLRRRLDHILYSPELDCTSARVHRIGPSDHFPVEAIISRKARSR